MSMKHRSAGSRRSRCSLRISGKVWVASLHDAGVEVSFDAESSLVTYVMKMSQAGCAATRFWPVAMGRRPRSGMQIAERAGVTADPAA